MITGQELAAWREHAPWSSDLMVEQDFLLSKSVAAIFEDDFLRGQVAMRGGTVLHKGHLAPASRYSEDIDLVLTGDRPPKHIERALKRVLGFLGEPSESVVTTMQLAVRNLVAKSKIVRTTYTYDPTSNDAALAHLKIEVNTSERENHFGLVPVSIIVPGEPGGTRTTEVQSYDLNEMLGTKLRALLQREHGRDLFDLWWAYKVCSLSRASSKLSPELVGQAFRFYMRQEGSSFNAAEVKRELDRRMNSKKFLRDMDGYLPVGKQYDPREAFEDFCQVFLPHIDG